jgi:hypothetical protein
MAYFLNPSHQYVNLLTVAEQRLGKNVTATTNIHATVKNLTPRRIEGKYAISSFQNLLFLKCSTTLKDFPCFRLVSARKLPYTCQFLMTVLFSWATYSELQVFSDKPWISK